MLNDKFGNPLFQEKDIFDLMYQNILSFDNIIIEPTEKIKEFENLSGTVFKKIPSNISNLDIKSFDEIYQDNWFIPEEYKNFDIAKFLVDNCPEENYSRLLEELKEYEQRNLFPLLRTLKYLVDTFRKHNILWGVGRGSSVASYVLYIIGVHKIDSIKYNLNWQEFLR